MDIAKTILSLVIVTASLLGCNRSKSSKVTKDPASGRQVVQMMQERLQASIIEHRTKQPAPKDVEATIAFGIAQQKRFPDDDNLSQALVAMMFQSIQFLQQDPPKLMRRRLEVGQLARKLLSKPEVVNQVKETLSLILLEESKGYIQKEDIEASWNSILESRKLGFQQSKFFYLDSTFEPILEKEDYAVQVKSWLIQDIDRAMAHQEAFPLSLSLQSLEDRDPSQQPQTISLEAFQDKKLMLLDLWGTWCPPCRANIPHLVQLQEQFADQLAVVGVNFEQPIGSASLEDTKARLQEFRKSQPMNYPCGYGDFDPRSSIPEFQGFPTMILIDTQGRVRLMMSGYHPPAVLETSVRRVLESTP